MQSACWILGRVLVLAVAGVEVNPAPLMEQGKTEQILKQVKNQKREDKAIQKLFKTHNRETGEVKN